MSFVVPDYCNKYPIMPHHNNIDRMYDAINEHKCTQEEWYVYLDFITNNEFQNTFDTMHGG